MSDATLLSNRVIDALNVGVVAAFQQLGEITARGMKEALSMREAVFTGRLQDSITYACLPYLPKGSISLFGRTPNVNPGNPNDLLFGGAAQPRDLITPVTKPFVLKIGTRNPYARHVNDGTAPHRTNRDQLEFIHKVTTWGFAHGLDATQVEGLIQYIRDNGTKAKPFMPQAEAYLRSAAPSVLKYAIQSQLRAMARKKTEISSSGVKVTITRSK